MRTPNEIRRQLERCADVDGACRGCLQLIAVLHAVLPQIAEVLTERVRNGADQRTVYHPMMCPDCVDDKPCARADALEGR